MRARLDVHHNTTLAFVGTLPFRAETLKFSEEVGGSGSLEFEAEGSDLDALSAWDAVIRVKLETTSGTWVNGPAYVTRHEWTDHRGGFRTWKMSCRSLLEAMASETVVLPEYVVGTMPRRAGAQRGIGWMSSAYNPASDPDEAWDACYQTGRTTKPDGWPTGSGAEWISATGATDETEGKFFRAWVTITGTAPRLTTWWLSSDESATLWIGGERIIETNSVETGKTEFSKHSMVLYPGTYAVGVYTATHFSKGGDGIDPILVAGAVVDSEGDPSSWIAHSNDTNWVACRRDNEPPDDVPPGPNVGAILRYMVDEAKERNTSCWDAISYGFTAANDSYGVAWGDITERLYDYGHHSYWTLFQSLAESDEADVWLSPSLVLHAAPKQGQARSLTLTTTHLHEFHTKGTEGYGTWVMAQALDGWLYHQRSGVPRREYALELGEAITRPVGSKIAKRSLKDAWRWDGSGSLNPPQAGWRPYVDFFVGDRVNLDYQAIERQVSITSLSAKAGEGGLLWDIEVTEWPLPTVTLVEQPRQAVAPIFGGAA